MMIWQIFFALALFVFLFAVVFAVVQSKRKYKSGRLINATRIMFFGVAISSVLMFVPIYNGVFASTKSGVVETFLVSVHNMIRLFVVDGEYEFVIRNLGGLSENMYKAYSLLASVLFVLAPILTFGFVLSFFRNFSSYKRFLFNRGRTAYIFSELNEKSLALAESLSATSEKKMFVFTDVFEREEEEIYELTEKAKELGAICFKKDIISIDFSKHKKSSPLYFFTIGADEAENISQSIKLISKYNNRDNTNLYVFSTKFEADMLLTSVEKGKVKVRRVNEIQSLIYRNLYKKGSRIFEQAKAKNGGRISAAVIGMGKHGTEMLKALPWFCQMDGYSVEINAFDCDESAEDRFIAECPELMDERYNRQSEDDGEAQYKIHIHCRKKPATDLKMDVNGAYFRDEFQKLGAVTYIFVALGSDEENIRASVELKSLAERMGNDEVFIQSIVYNTEKNDALQNIANYAGQDYGIDFIGDMKSSYSAEVILESELEEKALQRHLRWGNEEAFWKYRYNYRSSFASAIHSEMKKRCGIPGAELPPEEREMHDRIALRKLEHRRWNAYMRSEGYSWSGSVEKASRNDLAKLHCFLVPFDMLPAKEQEKDDD